MTSHFALRILWSLLLFISANISCANAIAKEESVDDLLNKTAAYIRTTPEKTVEPLKKLEELQSTFSQKQKERYYLLYASALGFRGRQEERVKLVESFIDQVTEPDLRIKFLYQLTYGYTKLGNFEKALLAINESIVLLPKLTDVRAKLYTLHSAYTVLSSLREYDAALGYAERAYQLGESDGAAVIRCVAIADLIEINFLKGNRQKGRSMLPDAKQVCSASNSNVIWLYVNAMAVKDLIDSGNYAQGIGAGLPLLSEFSKTEESSDYVTQLEESLARAYLNTGNLNKAERYGMSAYLHAKEKNVVELMERASTTMATIKRAQGHFAGAIEYYDIALSLKDRVFDEQLKKNLAFQRIKFDTQDKANQLSLLEQKNKVLAVEQQLEKRNNQNLLLVIALVTLLLVVLTAWLMKALHQKNLFRLYSQIDGLTQICNRSHFMAVSTEAFKRRTGLISIVLFDMDLFKRINDTFGHATGDWVLKNVSETIKTHLRKDDLFGRLGGEEFAICLPESDADVALQLAERCRMAIAMIDTEPSGFRFPLSASFGVATIDTRGLATFEATLEAADKALYRAKSDGRNCVVVFH
ncbi:MAG: GGDEF domain-containing protein [Burkholderiales bacterium]|nr:GGDEF domain-containing protein [Burkholderiales bacterium]